MLQLCVSCSDLGRCRFGLETVEARSRTAEFQLRCPADFAGAPGVAPGAWTAGVFDEVIGRLPYLLGTPVVTTRLEMDFLRPVPVDTPLLATSTVRERDGQRWLVDASLSLRSTGRLLACARGHCTERDPMTQGDRAHA